MTPSIFPHRIASVQLPPQLRRGRHSLRASSRPALSLQLTEQHTGEIAIATRRFRVPGPAFDVAMYTVVPAALYALLMLALVVTR